MAIGIVISTFGCTNGLILAGARAYYAMARDRVFFRSAGELNRARVPAWALGLQGLWAAFLVLPRTFDPVTRAYGNLYSNLLDYVISAALIFYILTIAGVFRLRQTRPAADRPYRTVGYPLVPALYIAGAVVILAVLFIFRPATTWPGLFIVLAPLMGFSAAECDERIGDLHALSAEGLQAILDRSVLECHAWLHTIRGPYPSLEMCVAGVVQHSEQQIRCNAIKFAQLRGDANARHRPAALPGRRRAAAASGSIRLRHRG
jgi:hypothetical protein